MQRRNKAFTLIELLVTIGIMAILATLTIYGTRSMLASSRSSATRVLLQTAESTYDEWRRAAGAVGRSPTQAYPQSLLPGSLAEDGGGGTTYRTQKAVRLARGFMFRMNQLPAIRKIISSVPAERLMTFPDIGNAAYAAAQADFLDMSIGECVNGGRTYICYGQHNTGDAANTPGTGDAWPNFWMETNAQTPVFVDAWNNPVLTFPACGFVVGTSLYTSQGVLNLNGRVDPRWSASANYVVGDIAIYAGGDGAWSVYRCILNHAASNARAPGTNSGHWQQIPTRPFFASAGLDGVFFDSGQPDTLQDNIYSYER